MSEQTFLTKMQEEVLDTEMEISMDTLLGDIEEWDSLANIQLIIAIEKELGDKIGANEVNQWSNVGDMVDSLLNK